MFLPFGEGVSARTFEIRGRIEPAGARFDSTLCSYASMGPLGLSEGIVESNDRSLLEELVAGGSAFGLPTLPGVSPDVDLDGDGLERVLLDEEGRVRACVDGDMTIIDGPECFLDDRMADGFSLTFSVTAVPAVFAGRRDDWRDLVEGVCDGGEPDPSLWDPI
jgi:hypothetical protein